MLYLKKRFTKRKGHSAITYKKLMQKRALKFNNTSKQQKL